MLSQNELDFWTWHAWYRHDALVPTADDHKIAFITGEIGNGPAFLGQPEAQRDRYWIGVERVGTEWQSLNENVTGEIDGAAWAASFPTGIEKEGLLNYENARFAQLMTNRNVPYIGAAGRKW